MIRPVAHLLGTLRSARAKHQRRRIAIERRRLTELRKTAEQVIGAQVERIANMEGRLRANSPHPNLGAVDVARLVERRAKASVLA